MPTYRWNTNSAAQAYDASAEYIHPHYLKIQNQILDQLNWLSTGPRLIVDLGGGSGRLMERILDRFPNAEGVLIDQSEPYLALASQRLSRFGSQASLMQARLQDDWGQRINRPADAIVSMSAIHHLDPSEKQDLYASCFHSLDAGGVLLNGDEFRPESESQYLEELKLWHKHMTEQIQAGNIVAEFQAMIDKWRVRNLDQFGTPPKSGDDCHERLVTQLGYLREIGFEHPKSTWNEGLWAIMEGRKPREQQR